MYPNRIPVGNVRTLADLKSLPLTKNGSAPDPEKEIRISGGSWKVKEQPGGGESKSRDAHRSAAVDGLKGLLATTLKKRNASHVEPDISNAVLGKNPTIARIKHQQQLQQVVSLIAQLDKQHPRLGAHRAADLLAYVVSDPTRLKALHGLGDVLSKAAAIMAKEGSLTTAAEAFTRASASGASSQEDAKQWATPPGTSKPDASAQENVLVHWHAGSDASHATRVKDAKHKQSSTASPDDAGHRDVARAKANADRIFKGVEPRALLQHLTADQKPHLLLILQEKLESLLSSAQPAESEKINLLRVAQFLNAWQTSKTTQAPLSASDYAHWPKPVLEGMARARELDSKKL